MAGSLTKYACGCQALTFSYSFPLFISRLSLSRFYLCWGVSKKYAASLWKFFVYAKVYRCVCVCVCVYSFMCTYVCVCAR